MKKQIKPQIYSLSHFLKIFKYSTIPYIVYGKKIYYRTIKKSGNIHTNFKIGVYLRREGRGKKKDVRRTLTVQ